MYTQKTMSAPITLAQPSWTLPLEMVRAGLHWSFKISRQMPPSDEMLGWNTLVMKRTLGGLKGSAEVYFNI